MNKVARVESLWRYPVKSMRGEELPHAFVGFSGIYGDRVYAIRSSAAAKGFPYLTARENGRMLQYRPVYRFPDRMAAPPNLSEAEALPPGATPLYADAAGSIIDVQTPDGEVLAIDDDRLLQRLRKEAGDRHDLSLLRSDRALTDCRPVSIFSIDTVAALSGEVGAELDKRRFRANIYIAFEQPAAFGENQFAGQTIRIGSQVTIAVVARDPRCKMITLDPDTSEPKPEVMKRVARDHGGTAGVYGAVVVEGTIRSGDEVVLLD